jgi:Rrf2 family protein
VFTQTAEYALRAVTWLAQNDGTPQTSQQVSRATQTPPSYLSKVLKELARAGVVRSARGKNGGFELAHDPAALTILQVVNAVDPMRRIRSCPLGLKSHRSLCPLHRQLDAAMATVEEALGSVTFSSLLASAATTPLCESPEPAARPLVEALR